MLLHMDAMQIGVILRSLRKHAGLTLAAVAAATGTTESYLSRVENGKANPSRDYFSHLAQYLAQEIANEKSSNHEAA